MQESTETGQKKGVLGMISSKPKTTPTNAVMDRLKQEKTNNMKKPLLAFADEDSDEDGNTYTNSVASNKHDSAKYVPPSLQLDVNAINKSADERDEVASLASTPRSRLSSA